MKKLMFLMMLFGLMTIITDSASAQNACSKEVDGRKVNFKVVNNSDKPLVVNWVDHKCKEGSSNNKIAPGGSTDIFGHNGHVFRVREVGTNKLLKEIVAAPSNPSQFTIGTGMSNPAKPAANTASAAPKNIKIGPKPTLAELVKDPNPMQGFLKTLNSVRKARNLPPMQFDNSLNQACQYLTDVSAKHDQLAHDPSKFANLNPQQRAEYTQMSDPAKRMVRFNYKGIPGVEAAGNSYYPNVNEIGGSALLQWAMGNTHYRPFLSLDGQIYKNVGFGYTKVPNTTDKYYTCAVFGNPKP